MPFENQRLPLLLALVAGAAMVGLTAWQVVSFWQAQQQQSAVTSTENLAERGRGANEPPEVELASLALFGTLSGDASGQPLETENLPETNLRLFLRGVLAADGEFPGSALIEDQKGNTEAYPVGEELPGNAKLRSVHPNRVVIERGGKLENLFFPEENNRSGLSVAADRGEPPPRAEPTAQSPSTTQTPESAADNEQRREEIRRRLEQLRERLRNNSN